MDDDTVSCIALGCIVFIVIGGIALLSLVHYSSAGRGTHKGYITAIEQEGYIYRNYRVYVKTDLSSSQEDVYCMQENRADLANKLREAQQNRQSVSVVYDGVRGIGYNLCDNYEIIDVQN